MYQRIMVAVDGSEISTKGLLEAIALVNQKTSRLAIIHVTDVVVPFGAGQFLGAYIHNTRELSKETRESAHKMAADHGIEAEMLSPEIFTSGSHVADTIADFVQHWKADLLVIGTHGRRGVGRMLLGSVAERVMRLAPCSLLLVRDNGVSR
jgi:nucleotide-binding universal stress UspA family protein